MGDKTRQEKQAEILGDAVTFRDPDCDLGVKKDLWTSFLLFASIRCGFPVVHPWQATLVAPAAVRLPLTAATDGSKSMGQGEEEGRCPAWVAR